MLMKRTELLLAHRMQASGRQYFFTMWKVSTRNAQAEHRMEEATRDAQRTTQQGRLSSIARFERMCRGRSDGRRITLAFSLWARNTARISSGHLTTVVQQRLEEMRAQCEQNIAHERREHKAQQRRWVPNLLLLLAETVQTPILKIAHQTATPLDSSRVFHGGRFLYSENKLDFRFCNVPANNNRGGSALTTA